MERAVTVLHTISFERGRPTTDRPDSESGCVNVGVNSLESVKKRFFLALMLSLGVGAGRFAVDGLSFG